MLTLAASNFYQDKLTPPLNDNTKQNYHRDQEYYNKKHQNN
uniref:Uncharacterized protein n=1 Tax=Bacillus subtilis subsp. natto TaxID=86029 RepID=E9RJ88_BACNA|nr:hypothetical protein [Bacillus subtilis subsp. natto]